MPTAETMPADELRRKVDALSWHHQIDLGQGVVSPGKDKSAEKLAALQLPDLAGKSVLDIGAWDGYFSFAAERLGASQVTAVDSFAWGGAEWGSQESFNLAREVLGSEVKDHYAEVLELSPERVGVHDVVLFLGVLYHMRHPLLALEHAASVTGELLVVETLGDMSLTRRPAAAFYPGSSMDNDDTNWWGPNAPALVGMLEAVGFDDVRVIDAPPAHRKLGKLAYNAANIAHSRVVSSRNPLSMNYLTTDRLIVHARR